MTDVTLANEDINLRLFVSADINVLLQTFLTTFFGDSMKSVRYSYNLNKNCKLLGLCGLSNVQISTFCLQLKCSTTKILRTEA